MIKKIAVLCSVIIFSTTLSMQDEPKNQKNRFNDSLISSLNIIRHGELLIVDSQGYQSATIKLQEKNNNETLSASNTLPTKKLTRSQKRKLRRRRCKQFIMQEYLEQLITEDSAFISEEDEREFQEEIAIERKNLFNYLLKKGLIKLPITRRSVEELREINDSSDTSFK